MQLTVNNSHAEGVHVSFASTVQTSAFGKEGRFPIREWLHSFVQSGTKSIFTNSNALCFVVPDKDEKAENIKKIISFGEFMEGWNGYTAKPIPQKALENALLAIKALEKQPQVFPTACRSVQLECEKDNGEYLEFEIGESRMRTFLIDSTGEEIEKESEFSVEIIAKAVEEFYAGM